MDNTVKETWIDKLVDELVDTKNNYARASAEIDQFYNLIKLIYNNSKLSYDNEGLRIENDSSIFEYLKVIDTEGYYRKLNNLKVEREAKIQRLAEEKAKSKGEIKEA